MNRNIRLVLDPLLQMTLVGIDGSIRQSLSAFEAGKAGNGLAKNERARQWLVHSIILRKEKFEQPQTIGLAKNHSSTSYGSSLVAGAGLEPATSGL